MSSRKFRPFTEDESAIINSNSGKINLEELAKLLNWNYTNLSSALRQHKITFISRKNTKVMPTRESSKMEKKFNEEGEELLTDNMAKSWF